MVKRDFLDVAEPLGRALELVAGAAASAEARWLIGGSTGLQLRGLALPAPPRDLDLYADDEAAKAIHEALRPYALDEQVISVSPMYRSLLSHYDILGVQVELVGGFVVASGADRYVVEVEAVLAPLAMSVAVGRYAAGVVPLAHELWFNILRARQDRVETICRYMRQDIGLHQEAVDGIASRNHLSAALREEVARLLTTK